MDTINSLIIKKRALKNHAENEGKQLIYNRKLGGYQIKSGFTCSIVEYPSRTSCNKLLLSSKQIERLASYI